MDDNNKKLSLKEEITKNFWFSDYTFPIFVAFLSAATFSGAHMLYTYNIGLFNGVSQVSMLRAGIEEGGAAYSTAAAYGASFLFARVLEGSLVGILDIGGSLHTGVGTGIAAMVLASGATILVTSFPLSIITGAVLGFLIGCTIILVKNFTVGKANSTFGADVMMGAGNSSGRFLGPLLVISACMASVPIGLFAIAGAALFYLWKKPISGGAIIGAMIAGVFFPLIAQ